MGHLLTFQAYHGIRTLLELVRIVNKGEIMSIHRCIITKKLYFMLRLTPSLLLPFSLAGPDVRLLDPPEHVPDSEVPGNNRWCNFSRRKPHAGPESSEEVCLPMVLGTNGS